MLRRTLMMSLAGIVIAGGIAYYFHSTNLATTTAAKAPVNLRIESFALNLTPSKLFDIESRRISTLLHAGLIAFDHDGAVRPVIAKSWERTGTTWKFAIREGITFSDGTPLRAQDVADSLCESMQPSVFFSWALASIQHERSPDGKTVTCSGIKASANAVEITEGKHVPWFLEALGSFAAWIVPRNAKSGPYGVIPGAGPYSVKEIVADSRVDLVGREGGPLKPGFQAVSFRYITDDTRAAKEFEAGNLQILEISSPILAALLLTDGGAAPGPKLAGNLLVAASDRIRILMIGEKSLRRKHFSTEQIEDFKKTLNQQVDRARIAQASKGIATPIATPFVIDGITVAPESPKNDAATFPPQRLTILTEADQFSDLVASMLPRKIGPVEISYKGIEKSLLINAIFKGEYDLVSIAFEGTHHTPLFWSSFFVPGSSLATFGKEIPGMELLDPANAGDSQKIADLIVARGNWIGLIREKRLVLTAPRIAGVRITQTGQTSYEFIHSK